MASWLGYADVKYTHSSNPVIVEQKGRPKTTIAELCKSTTPPCRLNPLLFNGHLQTMWTAIQDVDVPIYYKRRVFEADDPDYTGTFAVDFVVAPFDAERDRSLPNRTAHYKEAEFEALGGDDTKPMIICLHGLSGGSYEVYLRAVLKPLFDNGWEGCVVNSRGCAKSSITSGVLYNARSTWDARQMVKWIRKKWPNRKLYGIGFSLGANILTNYIGEEGDKCMLEAAVVCSNPWSLDVANLALRRTWVGREIYLKTMGRNMKRLFEKHVDQISKNPRIDIEKVRSITYLYEFDRVIQCPTWGYPTESAYYRDASSVVCHNPATASRSHGTLSPEALLTHSRLRGLDYFKKSNTKMPKDSLFNVKIPLLAINAEDDPISHTEAIPWEEFKQNPYLVLLTTSMGGHLSWFEMASNFLMKMAEEGIEVIKPEPILPPASDELGVAGKTAPYFPTRRKLMMSMDG